MFGGEKVPELTTKVLNSISSILRLQAYNLLLKMIGEIKGSLDWFRCVFVVSL